ncbi:amidohydrolase, partial [Ensifer sp. ENS08]|nr:amidohydrolase [Ensifer sp. ENS08]
MPTRRSFLGAASSLALPALFSSARTAGAQQTGDTSMTPDLILHSGLVTTLDRANPTATAVAVKDGLILAVGDDRTIMALAGSGTKT